MDKLVQISMAALLRSMALVCQVKIMHVPVMQKVEV